jgi:hypothetical protein
MSTMSEMRAPNNTVIIRAAGSPEIIWRTRRMISLGADAELAADIAGSTADLHDIERLLDAGCPLQLAWAIMRPFDQPVTVVGADADANG